MRWSVLACLTMLAALLAADSAIGRDDRADAPPCVRELFEGDGFLVCRYVPGRDELRLVRRGSDGKPGSLAELERALGADRPRVRFAMNAGMYDPKRRPLGLYVAAGHEEHPLDRATGAGNFYMQPNGVSGSTAMARPMSTRAKPSPQAAPGRSGRRSPVRCCCVPARSIRRSRRTALRAMSATASASSAGRRFS
jgi:hypothetical protein